MTAYTPLKKLIFCCQMSVPRPKIQKHNVWDMKNFDGSPPTNIINRFTVYTNCSEEDFGVALEKHLWASDIFLFLDAEIFGLLLIFWERNLCFPFTSSSLPSQFINIHLHKLYALLWQDFWRTLTGWTQHSVLDCYWMLSVHRPVGSCIKNTALYPIDPVIPVSDISVGIAVDFSDPVKYRLPSLDFFGAYQFPHKNIYSGWAGIVCKLDVPLHSKIL